MSLKSSILLKPAIAAAIAGGIGYAAPRSYNFYKDYKIKKDASDYEKMIARSLRSGKLSANNLSDDDIEISENMYKIASIGSAFNALMNASYVYSIKGAAKDGRDKYKLNFKVNARGPHEFVQNRYSGR